MIQSIGLLNFSSVWSIMFLVSINKIHRPLWKFYFISQWIQIFVLRKFRLRNILIIIMRFRAKRKEFHKLAINNLNSMFSLLFLLKSFFYLISGSYKNGKIIIPFRQIKYYLYRGCRN